jgi:putative cardiolipin synthase
MTAYELSCRKRPKLRAATCLVVRALRWTGALLLGLFVESAWSGTELVAPPPMAYVNAQIAANAGKTGIYVLETGEEALLARAWLVDHARESIEVQYFIWSTDNIGILAAEALLRAADRGVRVRVIVDDLMIDAPDKSLLALARHPGIDIRIYNPKTSVGVPVQKRVLNVVTDFRGVNQRMHDKTLVVDGKIAITGGRNMAAEYFDYNHEYNFRDRDALLLGEAAKALRASFDRFWASELSVEVDTLYDGLGLMQKNVRVDDGEVARLYDELHAYAGSPDNFAPEVRAAVAAAPASFDRLTQQMVWADVTFVSDRPGKNDQRIRLGGGGETTSALARLVGGARKEILIQSPYLVLSDEALALFREVTARGVSVRISTNSLASTDNLPAFSGYRNQRQQLLAMGLRIHEYKPDPEIRRILVPNTPAPARKAPVFALHAKTMVIDGKTVFIGTFNFDPRSENLNTEVGAIVHDERLAGAVARAIETDMSSGNSWDAAKDNPDQHASFLKRSKVRLIQWMPLRPLL